MRQRQKRGVLVRLVDGWVGWRDAKAASGHSSWWGVYILHVAEAAGGAHCMGQEQQ